MSNLRNARFARAILLAANFYKADLEGASLTWAEGGGANFSNANLRRASIITTFLSGSVLTRANLQEAILIDSTFNNADLRDADLRWADLSGAKFYDTDLSGADLREANLEGASFVRTHLEGANLSGCFIHGASVWNVYLENAIQDNLVITDKHEPTITLDNLEVAQFIYLLLNNQRIRHVIDTITSKVVLILGRFTEDRKKVLDALREELRQHDFTPVLFDFERPVNRDFTETVRTLAHLSRFIIADITEPSSIPQELQTIVPELEVPVQPILEEGSKQYSMFPDLRKHPWVFPVYFYKDQASLIASLKNEIIEPTSKKARELAVEKAKRLERS